MTPPAATALTVTEAPESNVPPPLVVPPSCGLDDNVTVYCCWIPIVKLATKARFPVIVKIYSALVETMFSPSVQLTNMYPAARTALTVTESPELNVPAPVVAPPSGGLDDNVTV